VQALLVVNPFASGVSEERIAQVEGVLRDSVELEVLLTRRPRHATEVARAAAGVDAIVVFSGDGVVNEVVNGIGPGVSLGVLPGGGTNVFARALGLARDPVRAAAQLGEALRQGRTRRISLGRVNGRRFVFSAGIGFDAELMRRVGRTADGRRPRDLRFAATAARMLVECRGRYEPALEINGVGRAAFAFVANGDPYTYAGRVALHVAAGTDFAAGLSLVAPERVRPLDVPRLFVAFARNTAPKAAVIRRHDLDRVEVRCDRPLPLQADGEDLGDVEHALFEAERGALSVVI
jgi:diacylglycerol kinase family enzyme